MGAEPPPSYCETGHQCPPIFLAQPTTTTTEVVCTTTQTTRFLPVPWRWKSTNSPLASPSLKKTADSDQGGFPPSNEPAHRPFIPEKELPPLPIEDPPAELTQTPLVAEPQNTLDVFSLQLPTSRAHHSSQRSPSPSVGVPTPSGSGIPPVTFPNSRSSEVNTVPFGPSSASRNAPPLLRKAKSLRFRQATLPSSHPHPAAPSRSRGISFSNLLPAFVSVDSRNADEIEEREFNRSHMKSLSRRRSLFSLKKQTPSDSSHSHRNEPEIRRDRAPSLPLIPPMDCKISLDTTPGFAPSPSPARLPRNRLEERHTSSPLRSSIIDISMPPQPLSSSAQSAHPPSPKPRRPATADGARRSGARSLFLDMSSPHDDSELLSRDSPAPARKRRPKTSPPPHHSAKLFGSLKSFDLTTASPDAIPVIESVSSTSSSHLKGAMKGLEPPSQGELPEVFLRKVQAAVNKREIASVLASSADSFYSRTLCLYIETFDFSNDPLDVALRKLLMHVGLPRETQQIDRVMEAFAGRYVQCNPALFASNDHPYMLAFSLIMLHTDFFNKANKRKMSKPDYVKNTRFPGMFPEVLECFYDNTVFAPFIFIEDGMDIISQHASTFEEASPMERPPLNRRSSSGTLILGKGNKVDPYYLIANNLLGSLRLDVEEIVPFEDPFSYVGTGGSWDADALQLTFANAKVIEMESSKIGPPSARLSGAGPGASMASDATESLRNTAMPSGELWALRIVKMGSLSRKDDFLEGGKKATNRKWKHWSVILTGSQLLFFRDLSSGPTEPDAPFAIPQEALLRPDELLSLKDAVAVYDRGYRKYANVFRFVLPDGRQLLLQSCHEQELNDWVSCINYASTYCSAGLRLRAAGPSREPAEMSGAASAGSHLNCNRNSRPPPRRYHTSYGDDILSPVGTSHEFSGLRDSVSRSWSGVDSDASSTSLPRIGEVHSSSQSFPEEPIARRPSFDHLRPPRSRRPPHKASQDSVWSNSHPDKYTTPEPSSRTHILRLRVAALDAKIAAARDQLDTDLRFARNIATLTPFQKRTRERLQAALQTVAKRITQVRLELVRLVCHREVLADDMAADGRLLGQMESMSLGRSATGSLQNQEAAAVPQMTLSIHVDKTMHPFTKTVDLETWDPLGSSMYGPFDSPLELGFDWLAPSSVTESSRSPLDIHRILDSPATSSSAALSLSHEQDSLSAEPELVASCNAEPRNEGRDRDATELHEQQSQDWDDTCFAQRASLVRMPSNVRLSRFFFGQRSTALGPDMWAIVPVTDRA